MLGICYFLYHIVLYFHNSASEEVYLDGEVKLSLIVCNDSLEALQGTCDDAHMVAFSQRLFSKAYLSVGIGDKEDESLHLNIGDAGWQRFPWSADGVEY